ncbi:MAG: hypothetical protein GF399_02345 [Candidatus Coatesbacteria bacterium]|nr:hypothetical protein [Candidatus Coatesbacteria bacterium]
MPSPAASSTRRPSTRQRSAIPGRWTRTAGCSSTPRRRGTTPSWPWGGWATASSLNSPA